MKKLVAFGLTAFIFSFHSFCQASYLDSLKRLLPSAKTDTQKIILLYKISNAYLGINDDSASACAERALKSAQAINFQKGIGNSLISKAVINRRRGDYALGIKHSLEALKIAESIGDETIISSATIEIGNAYFVQNNLDEAIRYYEISLQIEKKTDNKQAMAALTGNLGSCYLSNGNYIKALDYNQQSLQLEQERNNTQGIAESLINIGNVYYLRGYFAKAREYYEEAQKKYEGIDDQKTIASLLSNIGSVYDEEKNFPKAIEYFAKALSIAKKNNYKDLIEQVYQNFASCYEHQHNFQKAYEYHKLFSETKDSLLNEESSKQIAEMSTKYETEKKEQQITLLNKDKELQDAQLNRQKIIIWSVAGGLLIVLTLSVFIFRERKKSEKLLLNILPAETAKELKSKGKAKAKHYESVTVMFTDFKGFTNIAEKLSAEELVNELDFLFKKFDEIISRYSIEKIKTIGDAYMCASGLPTPNSNHAENIVKAAIEIQNFMKQLTEDGRQATDNTNHPSSAIRHQWLLRIGIHTGPVTAGVVGDKKFAYDIWGDTVNTASRMESSGEPGKINISGSTYELLSKSPFLEGGKGDVSFTHRGKIPAKNKGEIDMYFVEHA